MTYKLKSKEVAVVRARLHAEQHGRCKLCQNPVPLQEAVLDHCHEHGHIRGVLHRWCNSMLGKMENWAARSGKGKNNFFARAAKYVETHATPQHDLIHPTFKTPDEKAEAAKAAAKKRRAAKKAT